jgi:hypothetical protein
VTSGPVSSGPVTSRLVTQGRALLRQPPLPWTTVLVAAALMAYADGFWLISLQDAVGAIERTQGPFLHWLRDSTLLMVPFTAAVLAAAVWARRLFGEPVERPRVVLGTVALVVAAGTLVGISAIAASAVYDYRLQSAQIATMAEVHTRVTPAGPPIGQSAGQTDGQPNGLVADTHHATSGDGCLGTCQSRRLTRAVHLRAVAYAVPVLLVTNLVLVGWWVAARGGRLGVATSRSLRRSRPRAVTP